MDDPINLDRLAALRGEKPKSLMASIRLAWPEIKAALDRGHTLKAVHQRLQECGVNIGYRHLSAYVGRLRRRSPETVARSSGEIRTTPVPRKGTVRIERRREVEIGQGSAPNDPLANVREWTKKRPGFQFSDEPADERTLI